VSPNEKRALSEQILKNPVFTEILDGIEANAIEGMIYADTDQDRHVGALRVIAVRAFREDCLAMLNNDPKRKGAPA
jgi:hypothetical protein